MKNIVINIEGMSCGHCTSSVENALKGINGVSSVNVSLENKNAVVEFDENATNADAFIAAIEEQGFDASI